MDRPMVPEGEKRPPEAHVPDVVGLELNTALHRLGRHRFTLRFTSPPRPRGEKGAVRVVACRMTSGELEVVCAREYWDRAAGGSDGEGSG